MNDLRQGILALLAGTVLSTSSVGLAQSSPVNPDGVWSGTATSNGQQVPLRLEITGNGERVQGALINGKNFLNCVLRNAVLLFRYSCTFTTK